MSDFEEEEDGHAISLADIKESIKKNGGYGTPEYNDVLYLHYKNITKIDKLDPYVNLKALWLNNNAISIIDKLGALQKLTCLYLQANLIETIQGLDELVNLKTLVLSNNYITKIEGLSKCKMLSQLEIDHNRLREPEDLVELIENTEISILNMSDNCIAKEEFIETLEKLPNLRVLRMDGNPVTRTMDNYRRKMIIRNHELRFLDDAPVDEDERRIVEAWNLGGKEAEMAERAKIKEEKREKDKLHSKAFKKMQRDALIKAGIPLETRPDLMSSDDEETVKITEQPKVEEKEESFFVTEGEVGEEIDLRKPKIIKLDEDEIIPEDNDDQEQPEEKEEFVQIYAVEDTVEPFSKLKEETVTINTTDDINDVD